MKTAKPIKKIRLCLKCGQPFKSPGNHRRLCNNCRKQNINNHYDAADYLAPEIKQADKDDLEDPNNV